MRLRRPMGSKVRTANRRSAREYASRPLYVFPEALALLAVLARYAQRRHPDAKRQRSRRLRDLTFQRLRVAKAGR